MNERSNDMLQSKKQSVFLVGAKSLGNYGGYETFVDKLTEYHQNNTSIKYYVACKANGDGCIDEKKLTDIKRNSDNEFTYHNAICFKINIPNIGPAQAIYYDVAALKKSCEYLMVRVIFIQLVLRYPILKQILYYMHSGRSSSSLRM